jgi:amino acid transporter
MLEEYEKKRRKQVSLMRSLLDYGVGFLIVCAGVFFFFRDKWDLKLNERFIPNEWDKIFGIICVAYGAWRIYRGYKKNYFR